MCPHRPRLLLTATALLALATAPAVAGPAGGTVVGGAATIAGQGTAAVTVNQSSSSAIINWHTFNVGKSESVLFNQPSSSSVVLNRVTGGLGPSEILGSITANGRVFVINRDGVLFGPGAVINTAGFLATTNDIKNSDFMAGRYNFSIPGRPDASIVNSGTITAATGGFAALVAPGVRNSGTISATLGTVALAAGNSFTLDLYGDRLITLAVNDQIASKVIDVATGQPLKSLITNDGRIKANGGRVELTAAAARAVVDSVINTSGVITANSIGKHNGMIVLGAATGASKPAGAPRQTVVVSGTLAAAGKRSGTKGGTILVTGEDIKFVGALVDASGRAGGGKVLIGGDWAGGKPDTRLVVNQSAQLESYLIPTATTVSVDGATVIDASGRDKGDGGKVVLWSDLQTTFAGTILARGGAEGGNGGFVEVSGKQTLSFAGTVDTLAPRGTAGTLLLDPADYYIVANLGKSPAGASEITNAQVENLLAGGNVVIATNNNSNPAGQNGDIFVNANIGWSSANSLTLSAFRHINIAANLSNKSDAAIILRADNTGTGVGTVNFAGDPSIATSGPVSIYYNPPSYTDPQDAFFSGYLTGPLTAYMLVNNLDNLTGIGSNLAGTYALGRSIDGNAKTIAPIGSVSTPFTGLLDGAGHSISNLAIQATAVGDTASGLLASIGASGVVGNLALSDITVAANANVQGPGQFLGTLAGMSSGTISNVSTSGAVSGGGKSGVIAGGLLGYNAGIVDHAYASGNVTVGGTTAVVGGFVGINAGYLNQVFATGAVTNTATNSFLGGFVGVNADFDVKSNAGRIFQAFATGAVTGGVNSVIGGFAAVNTGRLDQTYAIGKLSGGSLIGGLVAANTSAPLRSTLADFNISLNGTGVAANSYWNPQTTGAGASAGGTTRSTQEFAAALPPGFTPAVWSLQPDPSYPHFSWQPGNTIPTQAPTVLDIPSQALIISNLVSNFQFASLNTSPVLTTSQGGILLPQFAALPPLGGGQPPGGFQPPPALPRIVDIPPPGETRFVEDEVLLQINPNVTIEQAQEAVRLLGLTLIDSSPLAGTTGQTVLRLRITDGRTVRDVIAQLASIQIIAVIQPVYIFVAGQQQPAGDPAVPAARGEPARQQDDPAQYILQKLRLTDAHRIVRGTNVPIAVIDSEIDAAHPDLQGVIAQRYSALGAPERPHAHGTGMAGAIASRQRLIGTAPSARLLAVHAFSSKAGAAESTTFAILKGIDWSVSQGARIINMSFAGPKDPSLERALKAAYDRGVVLIAAAGNAGPKSPPLYPGADKNVIAVTATDVDDKLFAGANRGNYVAVAAPGVDILVPAPDNAYQLTTGTSVAAAEVSGIVALLLERNPRLTPADIRRILTTSARRLGPGLRNDDFGSGLVDPLSALQSAEPRTVTAPPATRRQQ